MISITIDSSYFKSKKEKEVVQKKRPNHNYLLWKQADGEYISIDKMSTSHIINTLRLLLRHDSPIPTVYAGIMRTDWIKAFDEELEYRSTPISEEFW